MFSDTLTIIVGHPNTKIQISSMTKLINQMRGEGVERDVLVCTHCELPKSIKELPIFIYEDPENPKIEIDDLPYPKFNENYESPEVGFYDKKYFGFGSSFYYTNTTDKIKFQIPVRPHPWHFAALKNVENGIKFAKMNGYKYFNYMEADFDLHEDDINNFELIKNDLIKKNKKLYSIFYTNTSSEILYEKSDQLWGIGMELLVGEVDFFYDNIKWCKNIYEFKENCFQIFLETKLPKLTWAHELSIEAYVYENLKNLKDDILCEYKSSFRMGGQNKCDYFPNSKLQTQIIESEDIISILVNKGTNIVGVGIFAAEEPMEYQIIFSINNKVDSTINALKERYENNHYYFQLFFLEPGDIYTFQVIKARGGGATKLHKKLMYEKTLTIYDIDDYAEVDGERGRMYPMTFEYVE